MSKRAWIVIAIVLFISAILAGFGIYQMLQVGKQEQENNTQVAEEKITDECTEEGERYGSIGEEDISASSAEEKVSPNANLLIRKHYKQCDHTTKEYAEIPAEMVNKTQEEIEKEYPEYILVGFSPQEVIVEKEIQGICNEHYIVRPKDGFLVIYTVNASGKETLKEETGIATEYLPAEDLQQIKEGMKIYGKEALNRLIEDFE